MNEKPLVVVTGPGGRVGRAVLPVWGNRYRLRLFYRQHLPFLPPGAEAVQGDIGDLDALTQACQGADVLVHLAAHANEADFLTVLLPHNIIGGYNAFEAARRAGVRRVVFASTGQVGGFFPPTPDPAERATVQMRPTPRTIYACTKMWGEALGLHYALKYGLSVFALRIGWCDDVERVRRGGPAQNAWVSGRDLAEAIAACIEAPSHIDYFVSYVCSDNALAPWNCDPLHQLGWRPQDRWEDQVARASGEVEAREEG